MSALHTPGPWRTSALATDAVFAEGRCIAIADGEEMGQGVAQANARLMAAAPDMLVALIAAEIACTSGDKPDERFKARELIRAALDKAEGRS